MLAVFRKVFLKSKSKFHQTVHICKGVLQSLRMKDSNLSEFEKNCEGSFFSKFKNEGGYNNLSEFSKLKAFRLFSYILSYKNTASNSSFLVQLKTAGYNTFGQVS